MRVPVCFVPLICCGDPFSCGGNDCGSGCGIPGLVTLPQWFKEHGYYTAGMGKIFHEGADTQEQDYRYSWTPSTTNTKRACIEKVVGGGTLWCTVLCANKCTSWCYSF